MCRYGYYYYWPSVCTASASIIEVPQIDMVAAIARLGRRLCSPFFPVHDGLLLFLFYFFLLSIILGWFRHRRRIQELHSECYGKLLRRANWPLHPVCGKSRGNWLNSSQFIARLNVVFKCFALGCRKCCELSKFELAYYKLEQFLDSLTFPNLYYTCPKCFRS